jgi:hypothetical protein
MATVTTSTTVMMMTAHTTIMIMATGMDTVTGTTAIQTMTEISMTGIALTAIIFLLVWQSAIIFLPDWSAN